MHLSALLGCRFFLTQRRNVKSKALWDVNDKAILMSGRTALNDPMLPHLLAFCFWNRIPKHEAHIGKWVKPDEYVAVGAVFNRDFRHLSRLKTAPTGCVHLFTHMSQQSYQ